MNPFSLDAAFDLETPSESRQTLFPSTPINTQSLSDISAFVLTSITQEESSDPSCIIRNNLKNILSFLPICPALFYFKLVSKEWSETIMDIREEIYQGKASISLLTFSKHKKIINGVNVQSDTIVTTAQNTPQSYQSTSKSELNINFPLALLENLCDNNPLIGPNTHIQSVELLGLTISEMEFVLKKLAQTRNSSGFNKMIMPSTPSSGLLMDNFDAFPPTPAVFKSAANQTFNNIQPLIKNLVIGWPNTTVENNFVIPQLSNTAGGPVNSQVFSLSALDTSESQIQLPDDDEEDSDMDDFIEYDDDNQDYTTVNGAGEDEEDDDIVTSLKTTVSFNTSTISVLQSIETILIIDAVNERSLINYDILVDSFNAEALSSMDDVDFRVDSFSKEDYTPSKFNHLLDFIFFNTNPIYSCKMKFLRNPFFYYAEDSYHDMVNSELKPYLNALTQCKSCGPLFHYSRCLLSDVISNEFLIDIKFLKENWNVLLKPLYEYNLLNWNDTVYKYSTEKADVIQTVLKFVYELYANPNALSSQTFKQDLMSSFSETYSTFLENESVSLATNILETLAEWSRNTLPSNLDLKPYDIHHFSHCLNMKSSSYFTKAIDHFFMGIIKTLDSEETTRQIRSWNSLLESGQKRSLSTVPTPETKKKRIQL
ncbi:predicted protein [Naegleria gruberi]|uniref:Predicted protein n=1 Tax=Naegleria gruberi TaxID=5762 RepID=D2VBG0_NAEGR|nr:uncharacterized protein NAEGRDRAFT_66205 [Naegleria gruberi]EFC45901.1 predicted protein [Naegleria gruberi]|eukprot:XP_002678645.1 predicted protein [Naegleria gruberi strain NEG-M]